jgi:predicted DNA-binding transcriptional regulator AlpA
MSFRVEVSLAVTADGVAAGTPAHAYIEICPTVPAVKDALIKDGWSPPASSLQKAQRTRSADGAQPVQKMHEFNAAHPDSHAAAASLSTAEAADWLGLSAGYLNKLRTVGDGPPFVKIGRKVMYRPEDLEAWRAQRVKRSTTDDGGADA